MIKILNDRNLKILQAVLKHFISTAEPVGSRTISKKYLRDLSPATIRNAMSDLEDSGFLKQPHSSAGRVPTDRAYRFYVDNLCKIPKPSHKDSEAIKKQRKKMYISNKDSQIDLMLQMNCFQKMTILI